MNTKSSTGPQPVTWALFSLKGRIRRTTYALGMVLIFSLWWVLISQLNAAEDGSGQQIIWLLFLSITVLASTYCVYALSHKRLHDLGYRGIIALLLIAFQFILPPLGWVPYLALALIRGQKEDNEYGPPPVRDSAQR